MFDIERCHQGLRAAQSLVAGAPIGQRRHWLNVERLWLSRLDAAIRKQSEQLVHGEVVSVHARGSTPL